MNFWETITGGDLTRECKAFEARAEALPADYRAAWEQRETRRGRGVAPTGGRIAAGRDRPRPAPEEKGFGASARRCRKALFSEQDARRAPLPTSPLMTMSGLVHHLRWVEHHWIEVTLLGGEDRGPWTDDDPDREMRIAVDLPIAQLLADYQAACDRHRELVASLDLDTPSKGQLDWRDEPVTLRWILFHLIEETSRHNGHLDILRELADGVKGR
jgi:uncharacterized damage-inducible protein DinB